MDARIVAEAMEMRLSMPAEVKVVTTIKVDELVRKLVSLFDPAAILAPLLSLGNTSRSAVAPDYTFQGGVSALASA